jgi:preprotein translocase subunit SecY
MILDLARRIAFTVGALLLYRLGTYIPLPGIDIAAWARFFAQSDGILSQANIASGGAVARLGLLSLSLSPYLTATFLLQFCALVSGRLHASWTASERRRQSAERWTRILAAAVAALQSYGIARGLAGVPGLVVWPGDIFIVSTVLTLTGGMLFLVWLSSQITTRGIGNGIALIFVAGFLSLVPSNVALGLELVRQGVLSGNAMLAGALLVIALAAVVVVMERARRRLPVVFAERQVGTRTLPNRSADLALKLNPAGLAPVVLASWLLMIVLVPAELAIGPHGGWMTELLHALANVFSPLHQAVTLVLILLLTFVYTAFVCDPTDMAEKLKAHGGAIEDVAPGEATAEHLDGVLSRIATLGAVYLVFVVLLSFILTNYFIAFAPVLSSFLLGSTSLMILVCVTLDLQAQVRACLAQPSSR